MNQSVVWGNHNYLKNSQNSGRNTIIMDYHYVFSTSQGLYYGTPRGTVHEKKMFQLLFFTMKLMLTPYFCVTFWTFVHFYSTKKSYSTK